MAFEFTQEMSTISANLWAYTSAIGAVLCFLVLAVTAVVAIHPESRAHLDRVSFRIVVYALVANMIFGISSVVGGTRTGPGFICGFSIFVLQLTLQISSFLLFCIGLNLQLVVVHGVHGQRMEKLYLIISGVLATILVIPPYAAGQYGWDDLTRECWYTSTDSKTRLIWQLSTQMIWTSLIVVGEVVCATVVLVFMLQHNVRVRRIFVSARSFSHGSSAPQVLHANKYKSIILRIALYPLASCCVNLLSVVCAIHTTLSDGIHDGTDYNMLLLSDFLYGGRAIVYALLAASDPALVRGVKTLFSKTPFGRKMKTKSSSSKTSVSESSGHGTRPTEVFVELSTIQSPARELETVDKTATNPSEIISGSFDKNTILLGAAFEAPPLESLPGVTFAEGTRTDVEDLERRRIETQEQESQEAFRRQI